MLFIEVKIDWVKDTTMSQNRFLFSLEKFLIKIIVYMCIDN